MAEWEAPAKLNLDLRIGAQDGRGMHPLHSLVQEIDWTDILTVEEGDEDSLEVDGAELPEGGENLVWRAVEALGLASRPALRIHLEKRIGVAAGLGGGSSDAAATLAAVADLMGLGSEAARTASPSVGADVTFFLVGGTTRMEGYGELLTPLDSLEGFCFGVAVPPFELSTAVVYQRWDQLGGPVGDETPANRLPPALRSHGEVRNDLTPAALDLLPELGDWMQDLAEGWERPVFMTGSGPACYAYFLDEDEATSALAEVADYRAGKAAVPRRGGVARRD